MNGIEHFIKPKKCVVAQVIQEEIYPLKKEFIWTNW